MLVVGMSHSEGIGVDGGGGSEVLWGAALGGSGCKAGEGVPQEFVASEVSTASRAGRRVRRLECAVLERVIGRP
jgi:hypothetical protein